MSQSKIKIWFSNKYLHFKVPIYIFQSSIDEVDLWKINFKLEKFHYIGWNFRNTHLGEVKVSEA